MKKLLLILFCLPLMFSCGEKNIEKYDNKVGSDKNKTNTEEAAVDLCECMHAIVTDLIVLKTRKEQYACDQIVSSAMGGESLGESSIEAAYKFEEIMKNCDLLYLINNDKTAEKTIAETEKAEEKVQVEKTID